MSSYSDRPFTERMQPRFLIVCLGICALGWLGMLLQRQSSTPARAIARNFGTARAPYSDALGPWLYGGLHALFKLPQIHYLYRPTIGLFWGSVIAVTGRPESVPLVFLGFWFASVLAFLGLWQDSKLGVALAAWLWLLVTGFERSIVPLNPDTLMPDFPAFALTVLGTFLIITSANERTPSLLPRLIGGLVLGVAAAIRGPMLAGGVVLISCIFLRHGKSALKVMSIAFICFLIPIVGDVLLQKRYQVTNNGIVALFCAYADPSHTWSDQCHSRYLQLHPSLNEVRLGYIHFLATPSGVAFLARGVAAQLRRDFLPFQSTAWGVLLAALSLFSTWKILQSRKCRPSETGDAQFLLLRNQGCFLLVFWSFLIAARLAPSLTAFFACVVFLVLISITLKLKLWMPVALLGAYLAAVLFVASLGLDQYQRLTATFSFLLPFGGLLLVVPGVDQTRDLRLRGSCALTLPAVLLLAGLYTCWSWWPSPLRSTYLAEVEGRRAALKIADDDQVDRGLYFTGDHRLVYTHSDNMAVGSVRNYSAFEDPNRVANDSYVKPNTFLLFESGRSTAAGYWTTPTFAAGNFTASGSMTWTVAAGDVATFEYAMVGKTMFFNAQLNTTTVGGVADTQLLITLPNSAVAAKTQRYSCVVNDNGAGFVLGMAITAAGSPTLIIDKATVANWTLSTDQTSVDVSIKLEIQ